jgi:hypothetical protein
MPVDNAQVCQFPAVMACHVDTKAEQSGGGHQGLMVLTGVGVLLLELLPTPNCPFQLLPAQVKIGE